MQTLPRILGNHCYFMRDGTNITVPNADSAAGASSRTNRPAVTDPLMADFGYIESLTLTPETTEDEIWAPQPGILVRQDIIENKIAVTVKFEAEELSYLAFELAFRCKPLSTAGGVFNPTLGTTVKGWLHIEQYDQTQSTGDTPVNVVDLYVRLKIDGDLKCDATHVKTSFEAKSLFSAKSTGSLTNT